MAATPRFRPPRTPALPLALAIAAAACGGRAKTEFPIAVRAESDPGKPLAGVRFAAGGADLGSSGADGLTRLALSGRPGDRVELTVTCPDGYSAPAKPLAVVLRPLGEPDRVPEYRTLCAPNLRSLVVAVRAERGANLPVTYLGREIARTDASGAAHALLRVEPDRPVNVVLDTSGPEHALLRPQNPELRLVMPPRDEVALFEQTFTLAEPPKPKRRPQRTRGPVRLTAAR